MTIDNYCEHLTGFNFEDVFIGDIIDKDFEKYVDANNIKCYEWHICIVDGWIIFVNVTDGNHVICDDNKFIKWANDNSVKYEIRMELRGLL